MSLYLPKKETNYKPVCFVIFDEGGIPLRTASRLVKTNKVSLFKPIIDIVRMVVSFLMRGVNLNIDSDWLPKCKCHVNNQSEMLLDKGKQ